MSRYLDLARGAYEGTNYEINELSPSPQKNAGHFQPRTGGQRATGGTGAGTDYEITPTAQIPPIEPQKNAEKSHVRTTETQKNTERSQPQTEGVNSFISYFVSSYARVLATLEARCPEHVPLRCWQRAVEDGKRFLAQWGRQAAALGWTAGDLFGLHQPPAKPHPSYSRLSRYDCTGLIWLLQGRRVVALTAETAAIENPSGAVTVYRKNSEPALGPEGDSLDDLE